MKQQTWIKQALALGSVFFLAILLVKPIGVSTQFSVLAGIFHTALDESMVVKDETQTSGYAGSNAYYNKSEGAIAKAIDNPWNYDFVFVLAIPVGGYLAYAIKDKRRKSQMSNLGQVDTISVKKGIRFYLPSFLGGMILLYGARMADGCTSGHMMSGIMQGSVSGYIFAFFVFAIAIPAAIFVRQRTLRRN